MEVLNDCWKQIPSKNHQRQKWARCFFLELLRIADAIFGVLASMSYLKKGTSNHNQRLRSSSCSFTAELFPNRHIHSRTISHSCET